jgi:hypothetical protein
MQLAKFHIEKPKFFLLWLGWAYLAKKMQSPQPRQSQPPSNSVLETEKMGS